LEKKAQQVVPGSEEGGEENEGAGAEGRNGPNHVYTSEYINKEKKF
jgi:hypothetical protein